MYLIRPIRSSDLDNLETLALASHKGMTSLPKNKQLLTKKLELSAQSFAKDVKEASGEIYYFVLENTQENRAVGTCGIYSLTGIKEPVTFLKIQKTPRQCPSLDIVWEEQTLSPIAYSPGNTEICSLYLLHNYRKGGLGRLLSLCRFFFMAAFPQRFDPLITALMRGVFVNRDQCVFWDSVGKKLTGLSFDAILKHIEKGSGFINEVLPKAPILINFLPKEAQDAIGQSHQNTRPATRMLEGEGFRWNQEIDFFDGGPRILCPLKEIRCIRESSLLPVNKVIDKLEGKNHFIISNNRIDFRACFGCLEIETDHSGVVITSETARALEVEAGQSVRFATPMPNSKIRKSYDAVQASLY